jgi:hypothetical protein
VDDKQLLEVKPTCGLEYVSAFPASYQSVGDDRVAQQNARCKKNVIRVRRPIEAILLLLTGMSLLLGITLIVVASKLLIEPEA